MKILQLGEDETIELVDYYKIELRKIEEKRVRVLKLLKQLDKAISSTETYDSVISPKDIEVNSYDVPRYNLEWSWTEKIIYVLEKENKVMTKRKIFDNLIELDKNVASDEKLAGRSIGATLSRQNKNGKFKLYNGGNANYYAYGLPRWFNGNELKEEYK